MKEENDYLKSMKRLYLYDDVLPFSGINGSYIIMKTINDKPERNDMLEIDGWEYSLYVIDVNKAVGTYSQSVHEVKCVIVTDNPMSVFLPEKFTKIGTMFKIRKY